MKYSRLIASPCVGAAKAITSVISENELHPDYIIPSVLDRRVAPAVAAAVLPVAIENGVADDRGRARCPHPEVGSYPANASYLSACPSGFSILEVSRSSRHMDATFWLLGRNWIKRAITCSRSLGLAQRFRSSCRRIRTVSL